MMTIFTIDIIAIIVLILLGAYLKISKHYHWFDQPDETRKLHSQAIPTSAGLVFMTPVAVAFLFFPLMTPFHLVTIGVLLIILLLMGGIDDFIPISVKIRILTISLVSLYLINTVFHNADVNILVLGVYVLGLIWWLNLYNFMDGADGMTTLHALVTTMGYLSSYILLNPNDIQSMPLLFVSLFILCLLAFLLFNFPKARMFMGDSGSLSVAFVLAVLALYGLRLGIFDETFIISFHLCFIVDATLTLFMRLKFKHKLSQAHSLHFFQILIRNGSTHALVSTYYALVTTLLVSIALFLEYQDINFGTRLTILLVESGVLSLLWFNFHKKTKFKHFVQ